jgi:hypothetical protein
VVGGGTPIVASSSEMTNVHEAETCVQTFDIAIGRWETHYWAAPQGGIFGHSAVAVGDRIVLIGGVTRHPIDHTERTMQ